MSKVTNILIAGTGGQGVLKAAEVLAWAALFSGYHVKKSEVHGMAQRGGSVESHVRFGAEVASPIIPKGDADYLVSFHQDEHARILHFLKKEGRHFAGHLKTAEDTLPEKRYVNTYLLGVLSSHLDIPADSWIRAFEVVFSIKHIEENKKIFLQGRDFK